MKLVDQYGQPIDREALAAPQTEARASLLHLQRQIAGHPSRGITPARLNDILQAAEQGDLIAQHELFTDMEERDGHIFSELSKRKRASIKLDWDIVAPRNASKEEENHAAWAREQLQDMPDLEDMLLDLLDGISHGFSALELEWAMVGGTWQIAKFHHRPQSWFQLDHDTRTRLALRDNTANGQPLQPFGWVLHQHKAISGYISRSGLGRVLVWPYLFKHFSVGDLAEFLDIHGLPMIVGKYNASSATAEEKATLFRAVAGIGHNARGIIPSGMEIEIQQAADSKGDPFLSMMSWCERSQSKAINGSTLTSDGGATGLGSGLAEVHNEVRMDIRDSDCKQLAGTLTSQLIYPLLAINKGFADARRCPRFVFDISEAEDLKLFADSLPKLVGIGMRIPVDWAHEKLRIPVPSEKDDVLQIAAPAPPENASSGSTAGTPIGPKNPAQTPGQAKLSAALAIAQIGALNATQIGADDLSLSGPQPDLSGLKSIETGLDELPPQDLDWQAAGLLAPVVKAIMSADSFEGMQAALDAAIEEQDVTALSTALHRVGFAAFWLGTGDGL